MLTPIISTSEELDVGSAHDEFATEMEPGEIWRFISSTNCWIKQGDDSVAASAATGSMYVSAGEVVYLDAGYSQGGFLSVIRNSADGKATLTQMRDSDAIGSGVTE